MKKISVAVGVVIDDMHRVLIAKRHQHLHQGGKWEFPGGKIEEGESPAAALARELKEEVDIHIENPTSLMVLDFDYGDKLVSLDVWIVKTFSGVAKGNEGQEIQWVSIEYLSDFEFPEANQPIIDSLLKQFTDLN